jgi:lipopolysaccharide export LptBFGC system permease protein LptF
MPLLLYRYILREMCKILLTALAVMVVVMAFGFSLKPLSEGLLGPLQLVRVVAYTMPGMLTFALPFAVALASTLTFFRMSTDNEIVACAVSGISYRELLTPVLALGLLLTVIAFGLSNYVVPHFWKLVSQEVEQDVAKLVVKQIQKREVVELGKLVIYADSAEQDVKIEERPAGAPAPYNRMVLRGVAVGKLDKTGTELHGDYTAEQAVVDLYRDADDRHTYATMLLSGVTVNDPDSGTLVSVKTQPIESQELPSPFGQKPKFLSLPRLQYLAKHPETFREVREQKDDLAELITAQRLLEALKKKFDAPDHTLQVTNLYSQHYTITAPSAELGSRDHLALKSVPGKKILVTHRVGGVVTQKMEAEAGTLEVVLSALDQKPRVTLLLQTVQVFDPALPTPSNLKQVALPLLQTDEAQQVESMAHLSIAQALAQSREFPRKTIAKSAGLLELKVSDLLRGITGRLHERASMAVNCLMVTLLGAVMSMLLRNQVPLTIFFWCFMPTVVAFLMITSGQQMIGWHHSSPWLGITMTWTGNLGLALLVTAIYGRLARN